MAFFELLWWCQVRLPYSNMMIMIRSIMFQAIKHDYFSYFPDRYLLSITMIFGASVAGTDCLWLD